MNVVSLYPKSLDEMLFFQDNNIENIEVINTYNNLIAQSKYSEASNYISQHEEVYGFFANYLNAIENRIYSLQEYLLTKQKKNPYVLSDEEPESAEVGTIWI